MKTIKLRKRLKRRPKQTGYICNYARIYKEGLSEKAERFVDFYCGLSRYNATDAARRAGFSAHSAQVTGSQLLCNPIVMAGIDGHKLRMKQYAELQAIDILHELGKIAKADVREMFDNNGKLLSIHKMSESAAAGIAGFKVIRRKCKSPVVDVKVLDKEKALVDYGKHIGMFVDRREDISPTDFSINITTNKDKPHNPEYSPVPEPSDDSG